MSLRTLPAAVLTALQEDTITPELAARIVMPSGTIATHTGTGSFSYGGDTYLGDGRIADVDTIVEHSSFRPQPVRITMAGTDDTLIADADSDTYHGNDLNLYVFFFDKDDGSMFADPFEFWGGFIDVITVEEGDQIALTITGSHELERWSLADGRKLTSAHQQYAHPGDLGLEFVDDIADREIRWGNNIIAPVYIGNIWNFGGGRPGGAPLYDPK